MKILLVTLSIVSLLLLPLAAYTQSVTTVAAASTGQSVSAPPPISQPLIREGDFAIKLVSALNLGTANSGADAETILASAGIAPKNGWISDYPMTPVVIGQLQQSIEAAANAGRLPMNSSEAAKTFQALVANEGLPVQVASGTSPGEAATNYGEYSNPSVINNYYYGEGPPVVTYYAPPPDYLYLYTWVPYPFWWSGFWFPGYYCLNDFDVVLFVHHEREVCTNHFFNRATRRFVRIDPRTLAFERGVHGRRELALGHWREHAGAIYRHDFERFRAGNGAHFRGSAERGFARPQAMNHPTFHSPSMGDRSKGFHGDGGFAHGFHGGFGGRSFGGFHGSFGHSMNTPGARGFGGPGRSFGGFHSSPFIGGRSEGFHGGGGFAHGFHGGFGGRSFGGFHGGGFHGGGFHGGGMGHGRG
jgi:hypothetical protein